MDSLIKMCKTLNCTFDDVVEIVYDQKETEHGSN
jgi:DNA-binding Xre family transcriptional regulator